jgi:porin
MRPLRLIVVVALMSIGNARGQETTPTFPLGDVVGVPTSDVAGSPNSLARRPSLGTRLATWRPISRWLSRTLATQETVAAPATVDPSQPAGGTDATAPPAPAVNPAEGDPGATQPARGDPARATAAGTEGTSPGSVPISANPAAVDIIAGTGALGRLLGFDKDSGIRLGGLWIGDTSGVLSGGKNPGAWAFNSLTIADLNLDMEKLFGLTGGSFGIEFLQFTGQNTNGLAGAFPGFDSIEAGPPFLRNQLYELWYRQTLFDDKLIIRIGKSVPTYDFNNVSRPVPVGDDPSAAIPAVTALAYTPVFVNPTMLGVIPGYYNSATGITATLAPTKSVYLNYGAYDGNAANPNPALNGTGLSGPQFNGYYFHIGEFGYSYRVGEERKPGNFGVGVWGQTGKLNNFYGGPQLNGALGMYLFGAQRLWYRNPGVDNSGVSGFYQYGVNDSNALHARQYVGGGLTAFGLIPGRPDDSFGAGLNCTWLTGGVYSANAFYGEPYGTPLTNQMRPSQLMFQCYYQMKVVNGVFFQTNLTDIPTPGIPSQTANHPSFPNALAITLRLTVLF